MTAAADRQRRHRQRQRLGRVILHVEVDEITVATALIQRGALTEADALDLAKVEGAISALIAEITSPRP